MNPQPVKETEIQNINTAMTRALRARARARVSRKATTSGYRGTVANFTGVVVEVKAEKQKVRVNLSIFGRPPGRARFAQVEKV